MEPLQKNNIVFFGTSEIAVPVLQKLVGSALYRPRLVISRPDTQSKKGVLFQSAVSQYAREKELALLTPTLHTDKKYIDEFKNATPDVCVLFAYGMIIPKELLELPRLGWLNIHPSLLPSYRGPSPIQSVLLAGEKETGVSIIKMDEGIDTGPIIIQKKIHIDTQENTETLSKKVSGLAADMIIPCLESVFANMAEGKPQPPASPTPFTKKIKKEDGKLNWKEPATDLERKIRAYYPWPGAFTFFNGERIKILSARVITNEHQPPGSVKVTSKSIIIGAGGKSALEILTLQRSGKKPLPTEAFLRGFQNPEHITVS